jgi:hypothetical protein
MLTDPLIRLHLALRSKKIKLHTHSACGLCSFIGKITLFINIVNRHVCKTGVLVSP